MYYLKQNQLLFLFFTAGAISSSCIGLALVLELVELHRRSSRILIQTITPAQTRFTSVGSRCTELVTLLINGQLTQTKLRVVRETAIYPTPREVLLRF